MKSQNVTFSYSCRNLSSQLVASALELQLVKGHMDRIDDVLQTQLEQDRDAVMQPPRLRGHVSVKNVSFKYGEQAPLVVTPDETDEPRNRRADYFLSVDEPLVKTTGLRPSWKRVP